MGIADDLEKQAAALEAQATALREAAAKIRDSELTAKLQNVTVEGDMTPAANVGLDALAALKQQRWSVRRLAAALADPAQMREEPPIELSHMHLGRYLKGEVPVPAHVRRAIRKLTGVKI